MNLRHIVFIVSSILATATAYGQILTKEDSLAANLNFKSNTSVLSGYGEVFANVNGRYGTGTVNVERMVMFFGHRFNKNFQFFSELELEDAIVGNGKAGAFSLEQMVLKMNLNRQQYLLAGLYIPRLGIINENHLPTTFNGNQRNRIETMVIPTTWRDLGVCLYGQSYAIPGLNYTLGISNGLNAENMNYSTGIRGGRFNGSMASSKNIAINASLLQYYRNFRFQLAGYYGGSNRFGSIESDSIGLKSGVFSNPVALGDFNVQYLGKRFTAKALATYISIKDAQFINRAFGKNLAKSMYGAYVEGAYNLLKPLEGDLFSKQLWLFSRVEQLNLNYKIAENGIYDDFMKQFSVTSGITYKPTPGVAIKFDWQYLHTGDRNMALHVVNPFDPQRPFYNNNHFFNLGLAYSF